MAVGAAVELGAGFGFELVDGLHGGFAHDVGGGAAGGQVAQVAAADDVEAAVGELEGSDEGQDLFAGLAGVVYLDGPAELVADVVELAHVEGVGALVDGAAQLPLEGGLVRQGGGLGLGQVV